jgi:2-iminobutanoate/2-iminopropanoate deaminase
MVLQKRTVSASALVAAAMLGSIATYFVMGTAAQSQRRVELRPVNLLPEGNRLPYSDAIFAGNLLYISSRIGSDPATGRRPEDPEQEARAVLNSIKSVVEKAGLTMDDLVHVQIFCPDPATYFGMFNDVYKSYFGKYVPARAFTGSGPLVGGARFQAQAVAMKR